MMTIELDAKFVYALMCAAWTSIISSFKEFLVLYLQKSDSLARFNYFQKVFETR